MRKILVATLVLSTICTASNFSYAQEQISKQEQKEIRKEKRKVFFRKLGRKLGTIATAISTTTLRPFMNATAFMKASLGKSQISEKGLIVLEVLLEDQALMDRLANLYKEVGSQEEYLGRFSEIVMENMQERAERLGKKVAEMFLANFSIDFDVLAQDDDYMVLDKLLEGKLREVVEHMLATGELKDKSEIFDLGDIFECNAENGDCLKNLGATVVAAVMQQMIMTPMILSAISSAASTIYALPVTLAMGGFGVSVWQCLNQKGQLKIARYQEIMDDRTEEQLQEDLAANEELKKEFENVYEFRQFCSYVVNQSTFLMVRSLAKGTVAGNEFREDIQERVAERKAKRAAKKAAKTAAKEEQK